MNLLICDGRVAVQDQLRVLILQLFNRPEARSMTIEEIAKQVNAGRDYQFREAEVRSVADDLEMDNQVMVDVDSVYFLGVPISTGATAPGLEEEEELVAATKRAEAGEAQEEPEGEDDGCLDGSFGGSESPARATAPLNTTTESPAHPHDNTSFGGLEGLLDEEEELVPPPPGPSSQRTRGTKRTHLVFMQGSDAKGEVRAEVEQGQRRLLVAWGHLQAGNMTQEEYQRQMDRYFDTLS